MTAPTVPTTGATPEQIDRAAVDLGRVAPWPGYRVYVNTIRHYAAALVHTNERIVPASAVITPDLKATMRRVVDVARASLACDNQALRVYANELRDDDLDRLNALLTEVTA